MIRYRFPDLQLSGPEAARCDHPRLRRLRPAGPWRATVDGGVELEQLVPGWSATSWGDWLPGLDGCSYQVAGNLDLRPLRRQRISVDAVDVELGGGHHGPVEPARDEGLDVDMHGNVQPEGSGPYMQALMRARDVGKDLTWPQLFELSQLAVQSCHRCPAELGSAMRLYTTASCVRLLDAAYGVVGKAEPATAG